jgi:hypothetical protein
LRTVRASGLVPLQLARLRSLHGCSRRYWLALTRWLVVLTDTEGNCFFWAANGKIYPGNQDFGGESAKEGDRIGVLLDVPPPDNTFACDSLSVYRNGRRIGRRVAIGHRRHATDTDTYTHTGTDTDTDAGTGYRWAVAMPTHVTVRIEPAPLPFTEKATAVPHS